MAKTKVKVDGIAFYARVHTPSPEAEAYTLDFVADTEEAAKTLTEAGLLPAKRLTGEVVAHEGYPNAPVFRFKSNVAKRDGTPLPKPKVVDSQANPITALVGNGSKVRIYGNTYDWTFKNRTGVGAGFNVLQVLDLVEFDPIDKVEGGFVSKDVADIPTDIDVDDESAF